MDRIKIFIKRFMNKNLPYMFRHEFEDSWAITRKHLTEAIQYLPVELQKEEKLKDFNEYLAPNELGLSLDTLIDLVKENIFPIRVELIQQLKAAALEMK
jgi:hypothetical protein